MTVAKFRSLVGCPLPLQQAGMGGVAGADLAAAVADAGALGMIGAARLPAAHLARLLDDLAVRTRGSFGVNFLVPFLDPDALAVAASRCRLVEFFFGEPNPARVEVVHKGGAAAAWQVGSVDEAKAAADAGCDMIIVQGVEAGGHVRGTVALLPLLDGVLDAVSVPVVAGGGIGSARGVAAVLAAGASAARVGTRFVAAAESLAHPLYKQALVDAEPADTVLTEAFGANWPHAPHRVLRCSVDAASALPAGAIAAEIEVAGTKVPLPRFSSPPPTRSAVGNIRALPMYAGQSVGAVRRLQPAAEIVAELCGS